MLKTVIVTPPMPDWIVSPFPLLGPSILKTFLDSHGYKIDLVDLSVRVRYLNRFRVRRIFDLKLFQKRDNLINFLENREEEDIKCETEKLIKLGRLENYDVVGFTLYDETNIIFSLCIAKVLKEKYGKKIVFGGPIATRADYSGLLNFDFIDFFVAGDGEEPFLKILRHFEGMESVENCDGISYKKDEKVHIAKPSFFDLDKNPIPTFNMDDLELYKKLNTKGLSILPYLLTRGCRFKCAFCSEYRNVLFDYVPVEKVISEIKILLKTYGANSIYFAEANMNNDPEYVEMLSKRIIEEGLKFSWGGLGTIFGLDENKIRLMAKAGCKYVLLGVESASENILDKMKIRKVSNLEKFKETLKLLRKYGIGTHNFYIVEFPYENELDFKKNIVFIKETAKYTTTAGTSIYQLVENSPVYLVPKVFNIHIKERPNNKFRFLDRFWQFDEINGLAWEEKYRRGKIKEKLLQNIIYKEIILRLALISWIKDPMRMIKKSISNPYISYDEYFV